MTAPGFWCRLPRARGLAARWLRAASGALFVAGLFTGGCSKKSEVIVETAAGREAAPEAIDRDPFALFPPNPIGYLQMDAKALFASPFGERLKVLLAKRSPLPASSGFEPSRDLDALYLASYSMRGLDVVGVAVGRFDVAKIEQAAAAAEPTPRGAPLTKSTYAGRSLYTSGDVGFSVLTEKTILIGNETGIRRALDRIKEGRVTRSLEPSVIALLETPEAAFRAGADLKGSPLPEAARKRFAFLEHLAGVRAVGNFKPPGINLVGTATYETGEAATTASESLRRIHEILAPFAFVLRAFIGTDQPVRRVEAVPRGQDMQFAIELDGDAVSNVLLKLDHMLGLVAPRPEPAPSPEQRAEASGMLRRMPLPGTLGPVLVPQFCRIEDL